MVSIMAEEVKVAVVAEAAVEVVVEIVVVVVVEVGWNLSGAIEVVVGRCR